MGIRMPGIFICGDAEGDACGICIPGMFICVCGDGEGDGCGICIPGMFCICSVDACGAADCLGDDGCAGIFIPGMLPISFFFPVCFFRAVFFFFRVIAFDLYFAFDLLVPGMLDISCCARTGTLATSTTLITNKSPNLMRVLQLITSIPIIILPGKSLRPQPTVKKDLRSGNEKIKSL